MAKLATFTLISSAVEIKSFCSNYDYCPYCPHWNKDKKECYFESVGMGLPCDWNLPEEIK